MPLWRSGILNDNPAVKFNDEMNQRLIIQDPIDQLRFREFCCTTDRAIKPSRQQNPGWKFFTTNQNGYYSFGYENNGVLISSTRSSKVWSIYSVEFENDTCRLRINGRLEGSSQNLNVISPLDEIGENFSGYIAEVFVFDQLVAKDDRQALEGYLNFKWNLEVLPTLHPYSSAPPSFGEVNSLPGSILEISLKKDFQTWKLNQSVIGFFIAGNLFIWASRDLCFK